MAINTQAKRRMGRPPRFKSQQIAEALKLSGGIIAGAAKILSCDRSLITDAMERDPSLKEAQTSARENDLDYCETKLRAAYGAGEGWAIRFFLERAGRHRGWGTAAAQINANGAFNVILKGDDARL